jgi:hypothetical protein
MAKRKTKKSGPVSKAQEALQVTFVLKGNLKRAQILYLFIGAQLVRVRDEKLYAELHHPDLESYAAERLKLGRSSLYRYLQVYDWARKFHKEWTEPNCPGFIPVLSDATDLMWIEYELAKPDLDPKKRAALEQLRQQGLAGTLPRSALRQWRKAKRPGADQAVATFLSALRRLRRQGAKYTALPAEVLAHLEAAIALIENAKPVQLAAFDLLPPPTGARWPIYV